MTLSEKQRAFTKLLSCLIRYAYKSGYELTLGEAWRPEATAKYYASIGKGISKSLHTVRLAIDLNLFKDGKYLTDSKDYTFLGEFWEELGRKLKINTKWGGRFKRPDGNHFSIEHEGRA